MQRRAVLRKGLFGIERFVVRFWTLSKLFSSAWIHEHRVRCGCLSLPLNVRKIRHSTSTNWYINRCLQNYFCDCTEIVSCALSSD